MTTQTHLSPRCDTMHVMHTRMHATLHHTRSSSCRIGGFGVHHINVSIHTHTHARARALPQIHTQSLVSKLKKRKRKQTTHKRRCMVCKTKHAHKYCPKCVYLIRSGKCPAQSLHIVVSNMFGNVSVWYISVFDAYLRIYWQDTLLY